MYYKVTETENGYFKVYKKRKYWFGLWELYYICTKRNEAEAIISDLMSSDIHTERKYGKEKGIVYKTNLYKEMKNSDPNCI